MFPEDERGGHTVRQVDRAGEKESQNSFQQGNEGYFCGPAGVLEQEGFWFWAQGSSQLGKDGEKTFFFADRCSFISSPENYVR